MAHQYERVGCPHDERQGVHKGGRSRADGEEGQRGSDPEGRPDSVGHLHATHRPAELLKVGGAGGRRGRGEGGAGVWSWGMRRRGGGIRGEGGMGHRNLTAKETREGS